MGAGNTVARQAEWVVIVMCTTMTKGSRAENDKMGSANLQS